MKVQAFCARCGAVGKLRWVSNADYRAVRCFAGREDGAIDGDGETCTAWYANMARVWEEMRGHPKFDEHVAPHDAKLAAAEEKRARRAEKRSQWGRYGI